jgi:LysM repeat protein
MPWWVNQTASDPGWKNRMPEYKPAEMPYANRINSGQRAQQYFTFGGSHIAGILQRVTVPANAQLEFSIMGQAWSTGISWDGPNSDAPYSAEPTPVNMRIGIDPTGGTNPWSPAVIWSTSANPYDQYIRFSMQATAQGDAVTVFTYSAPEEGRKHNDIYWDDASLVVIGQGAPAPAPAPAGGGDAAAAAPVAARVYVPGPTPTPDADGVIYAVVQPGDSLWAIAARASLTLDEVLELNSLNKDSFISLGQKVVIGYGEPGGSDEAEEEADASAEATTADDATADEATDAAAAESADSAETAAASEAAAQDSAVAVVNETTEGATICLKAFDDKNRSGAHEGAEPLMQAVAFTISDGQTVVSNYITDGASEPYCIRGLKDGSYRVTRSRLANEELTTPGDWAISLTSGGSVDLAFGSVIVADEAVAEAAVVENGAAEPAVAAMAEDSGSAETVAAAAPQSTGPSNALLISVVVVAVVLLGAVVGLILTRRGSEA